MLELSATRPRKIGGLPFDRPFSKRYEEIRRDRDRLRNGPL
jgi:hypothetical protein